MRPKATASKNETKAIGVFSSAMASSVRMQKKQNKQKIAANNMMFLL